MKRIILASIIFSISAPALADEYVHGYQRANGTYVQPYERTSPNNTTADNYSTKGNTNPYTGQAGTVNPEPAYQQAPSIYVPAPNSDSSFR
jgi:uncharacterized protein YdeI (BOF family)